MIDTNQASEDELKKRIGNLHAYNFDGDDVTVKVMVDEGILESIAKFVEAIIRQAEPGTWVDPDDTDDLEWQGYVKGVQDYKDNLRQALYGKDENEDE